MCVCVCVVGKLFKNLNCLEGILFVFLWTETGLAFLDRSRTEMGTPTPSLQVKKMVIKLLLHSTNTHSTKPPIITFKTLLLFLLLIITNFHEYMYMAQKITDFIRN